MQHELAAVQQTLTTARADLAASTAQVAEVTSKRDRLEVALQRETARLSETRGLLQEAEERLGEQDGLLVTFRTELETLRAQQASQLAENQHQNTLTRERYHRDIAARDDRVTSVEERLGQEQAVSAGLQEQLDALKLQQVTDQQQLQTLERAISTLRGEVQTETERVSDLELSLEQARKEAKDFQSQARTLQMEVESVRAESTANTAHWEQVLEHRESRISAMASQSQSLSALEARVVALNSELGTALRDVESGGQQREQLLAALQAESSRVAVTVSALAEVQGKLLEKDDLLSQKEREISDLNLKLLVSNQQVQQQTAVVELQRSLGDTTAGTVSASANPLPDSSSGQLAARLVLLQAQLDDTSAALREKTRELEAAHAMQQAEAVQTAELQSRWTQARDQCTDLQQRLARAEALLSDMQATAALSQCNSQDEKSVYADSLVKARQALADQQRMADDLRQQLASESAQRVLAAERATKLGLQLADLHAAQSSTLSQVRQLQDQLTEARARASAMEGTSQSAQQLAGVTQREAQAQRSRLEQMEAQLLEAAADHTARLMAARAERDSAVHELQGRVAQVTAELAEARATASAFEAKMATQLTLQTESTATGAAQTAALESEIAGLRSQTSAQATSITGLERELAALRLQGSQAAAYSEKTLQAKAALETEVARARAQVDELQDQLDARQLQLQTLRAETQALEQRLAVEREEHTATVAQYQVLLRDKSTLGRLHGSP